MSLSDEVSRALLRASDRKAKRQNGRIVFRCYRHDDRTPSAWMKDGSHGCFACGFTEPIQTLAPLVGVELLGSNDGYTLEDYAREKQFPLEGLRSFGLSTETVNGREVVAIPYYGTNGEVLRRRFRSRRDKWWEGRHQPIYLYGIDRLTDAKPGDQVLVVEGESDCHAAWLAGFKAVGVPGATTWKREWAEHLNGLEVFVWEEPDQGGAQLVSSLAVDFPKARIANSAKVKDLAEAWAKAKGNADTFTRGLRAIMAEAPTIGTPKPSVQFDPLLYEHVERLIERKQRPVDAVPTPFPAWNSACCGEGGRVGLARGWHVVAAAKTGLGKSILALNLAAHAVRAGERVSFVSLEMGQAELETRFLAIFAGQNVVPLEQGRGFDASAVAAAAKRLEEVYERTGGVFYSNREPVHSVDEVLASMRYNHDVLGCRYFLIDYIQLAGNANDPESITGTSHAVRKLTKDLQVVTVALSQFNRTTSVQRDLRPSKEGLMGGSALENDADQVLLIDHSRITKSEHGVRGSGWEGWALLDKNRHGPMREIPMFFSRETLQMYEIEPPRGEADAA